MAFSDSVVAVEACASYRDEEVISALRSAVESAGGLGFIRPGMTVAVKANLAVGAPPERAVTTHPAVLKALATLLFEKGAARVIIGDSPGGPFTAPYLHTVYASCGLNALRDAGAELNADFTVTTLPFPEGSSVRIFDESGRRAFACCSWLTRADAVINVCKLKTHGMMGMTAAVKNMYGAVPGNMKQEYHYRCPGAEPFADMLIDLQLALRPALHIADAVVGMEGNGPTQGTPRQIGALLASRDCFALDLACARMIGMSCRDIPTLSRAAERGLAPDSADAIRMAGSGAGIRIPDIDAAAPRSTDGGFYKGKSEALGRFFNGAVKTLLASRPAVKQGACIGCGKCASLCPAKAIRIVNKRARIARADCIRCFCCQEFCPVGAMTAKRPPVARLLTPKVHRR